MSLEADPTATPIVVVGINRSGTKWLSNEIASHPDVAAVQADVHGGIVESNLLTDFGRRFNLSADADEGYARFLDFWSRTHFFELAGGDVESFRALQRRPANSIEAFRMLMESYARRLNKSYWLQKVAPADAEAVLEFIPDAKVVAIERSAVDTARSRIQLDAKRGMVTSPFRAGMSQGVQMRQLDRLLQKREALVVRYENLVDDRKKVMSEVQAFVGLRPCETSSPFSPNTSFKRQQDRKATMGTGGEILVGLAVAVCGVVPVRFLEHLQRRWTRGRPDIIPGTYYHEDA